MNAKGKVISMKTKLNTFEKVNKSINKIILK